MTFKHFLLGLPALLVLLTSCINEDLQLCPPLKINIDIKDKNYFNVDKVDSEPRRSEDLAFREYVPTIYYTLRDASDGTIVEESEIITVKGESQIHQVTFSDDLPHGRYIFTVWGGMGDLNTHSDDRRSMNFHPGNIEGRDLYLVNDTILYDMAHSDHTVSMERIKGKLIIQGENLPDGIEYYEKSIDNLFSAVTHEFQYNGTTHVKNSRSWSGKNVVTGTILAPSTIDRGSLLSLQFHDGSLSARATDTPDIKPYKLSVTMSRNMLTVVRYVWNEVKQDFNIYVLINDNWEQIHGLEIDD